LPNELEAPFQALEQKRYRHEKHCNTGFAGKAHLASSRLLGDQRRFFW